MLTNREDVSKYNEHDKKMRLNSLYHYIFPVYNENCQLFSVFIIIYGGSKNEGIKVIV